MRLVQLQMRFIATCILLCLMVREGFGAKILGLLPFPGKSHLPITSSLLHSLVKKGHDVTAFVPHSTGFSAANYKEINYNATPIADNVDVMQFITQNYFIRRFRFYQMGTLTTERALNTSEARNLMRSEEKYDVIVMEEFMNEAFYVFAHKFKCPVVLVHSFGATSVVNRIFGNSAPRNYVPLEYQNFTDKMTLLERLENSIKTIFRDLTRELFYIPRQQALAVEYFGDSGVEIPDLEEIIARQTDFILINSHPAFYTPRPYMANMKDVGGLHLKPAKPLPSDLQQYLDSSQNGVILFSLGSAMQSTLIPEHLSQALKKAFARLPFDVLWKWENDTMANKSSNVRIGKWLPQNDILAHPNLKLFITHGGISSLMEAVYHGVPIVGIPLFADQPSNILLAQTRGYAESLVLQTMTEDQIYNTIMKVSTDPKYKDNAKKISAYWRNQMNHPLDQAVHWVEYVIKHGGAKHLKAAVTEQTFVQYLLLDVAFVILATLASAFFLMRQTIRLFCKASCTYKEKSKKID